MIDLTKYESLIRDLVSKENDKDPNWDWFVKSVEPASVSIQWGYLDFMEEKENCFFLEMQNEPEESGIGDWLWAKGPHKEAYECFLVVEGVPNPKIGAEQTIQSGLSDAIFEIAYRAHHHY